MDIPGFLTDLVGSCAHEAKSASQSILSLSVQDQECTKVRSLASNLVDSSSSEPCSDEKAFDFSQKTCPVENCACQPSLLNNVFLHDHPLDLSLISTSTGHNPNTTSENSSVYDTNSIDDMNFQRVMDSTNNLPVECGKNFDGNSAQIRATPEVNRSTHFPESTGGEGFFASDFASEFLSPIPQVGNRLPTESTVETWTVDENLQNSFPQKLMSQGNLLDGYPQYAEISRTQSQPTSASFPSIDVACIDFTAHHETITSVEQNSLDCAWPTPFNFGYGGGGCELGLQSYNPLASMTDYPFSSNSADFDATPNFFDYLMGRVGLTEGEDFRILPNSQPFVSERHSPIAVHPFDRTMLPNYNEDFSDLILLPSPAETCQSTSSCDNLPDPSLSSFIVESTLRQNSSDIAGFHGYWPAVEGDSSPEVTDNEAQSFSLSDSSRADIHSSAILGADSSLLSSDQPIDFSVRNCPIMIDQQTLLGILWTVVVAREVFSLSIKEGDILTVVMDLCDSSSCNVRLQNSDKETIGYLLPKISHLVTDLIRKDVAGKITGLVKAQVVAMKSIPVQLSFIGVVDNQKELERLVEEYGERLEQRGGRDEFASDDEQVASATDKVFICPDTDGNKILEEAEPDKCVMTTLYPHQKQALHWMISRENNPELSPYWMEIGLGWYRNTLSSVVTAEKPIARGGILADDMGLGKTLQMIALIMTNSWNERPLYEPPPGLCGKRKIEKMGTSKEDCPRPRKKQIADSWKIGNCTEQSKVPGEQVRSHTGDSLKASLPNDQAAVMYANVSEDSKDFQRPFCGDSSVMESSKKSHLFNVQDVSTDNLSELQVVDEQIGNSETKPTIVDSAREYFHVKDYVKLEFLQNCETVRNASSESFDNAKGLQSNELCKATLIVCPLSVLNNWQTQLRDHVHEGVDLKVLLFHGPSRNHLKNTLRSQDVVLTTYQVLATEHKAGGALYALKWMRVILDEAHVIRNPEAKQTKAVLDLKAQRKWALTGTPIQNEVGDLWPIINFLDLKTFKSKIHWHHSVAKLTRKQDRTGLKRLRYIMSTISLRRLKTQIVNGSPIVELPDRKVVLKHISLTEDERQAYDTMLCEGRLHVNRYFQQGTALNHFGDILAIILRLRQLCCHPHLLQKAAKSAQKALESCSLPENVKEDLIKKIQVLQDASNVEECSICLDTLNRPVITYCGHIFCRACIENVLREAEIPVCPLCRAAVQLNQILDAPAEIVNDGDDADSGATWQSSSKVDAVLQELVALRAVDPTVKSIVVSQFTSFLAMIQRPLRDLNFNFVTLVGNMNKHQREAVIEQFSCSDPGSPTVILLSLRAGGIGINLIAASRLFLLDPAWNPACEEQCFDRCHRLGQTKDVVITKFVVENSIEEMMLLVQERKKSLAQEALRSNKSFKEQSREKRIDEIKTLLQM